MASGRVTIQDVADKLGLSKFSVSRALSGKSGVSETTRHRVLRMAQSMGYRVNQEFAPTTGQILFIRQEIDPVSSELWLNIMHGAEREGERFGLTIVPRQARYLTEEGPIDPQVVGLILAVPRPGGLAKVAVRTGLPVVSASYVSPMERVDQVSGTDWESGFAVAQLLTELGHRALLFVHGNATPVGRSERLRGFRDGARDVAEAAVDDLVFDEQLGFRAPFLDYLAGGAAPTALFCAHDGLAVTVISELHRLGIRVPEDVSVVGFNDFVAATQVAPRLTTVRTPQVAIGAAMVRCIADRLASEEAATRPPVRVALVAEIVTRESTGPASPPTTWRNRILKQVKG